ncbi:nose resistant to fluoxetine protein 6-like [Athalia rosae]|uniref:nose resistant to fluoxetine protein 6-like n=1 Tax=Athalia rosae TaxID=37344 RepID=UPI00203351B4|nr:nose resistant to fluoxetine protein 6-like [Athalia rosae]
MYFFPKSKSLIIVSLLIILVVDLVCGKLKEEFIREQHDVGKLLTNYLKTPWINLNSSWADEVNTDCKNDIATLYESADAGKLWAIQMLDAMSKIPSGILTGNIVDLGTYDECIGAKNDDNSNNIQGKHCIVSIAIPPEFSKDPSEIFFSQKLSPYNQSPHVAYSLSASLCLPSTCKVDDVIGLVNSSIRSTPALAKIEAKTLYATCSEVESEDPLFLGRVLTLSLFTVVLSLLIFSTGCDLMLRSGSIRPLPALEISAKFSLYTNARKLCSMEIAPGTLPAIYGMRFISSCLVVLGHRMIILLMKPHVNLTYLLTLRRTPLSLIVLTLPLAVDTFFVVSGFLMGYLFLKALRSGRKVNILQLYLHRYLRLTPCIVLLLLMSIYILPVLGSGPIWGPFFGIMGKYCQKNWWTNLLYIQNLVDREEICLPHTWYAAVDMQLFWIAPFVILLLHHHPKIGITLWSVISIVALVIPVVDLVMNQYSVLWNINKDIITIYRDFFNYYSVTYNRVLPYFIGLFLGYDLVVNKRNLSKIQATINWIIAIMFLMICFFGTYLIQPNADTYNEVVEAVYVTVARFGWSTAMAWILYASTQGYGGPVTSFLSLPVFVPLNRLSYSIYLVHLLIQATGNAAQRVPEYLSPFGLIHIFFGDLMLAIIAAFCLNLCCETPVIVLEKILRAQESPPITKRPSIISKEKPLDVVKGYSDLIRSRIDPNTGTNTITSQSDFWETVSDILNALGKKSTKTPAELAKSWQDWQSVNKMNNESNWDQTRHQTTINVENGPCQLQTETNRLENELLLFLVSMTDAMDDPISGNDSESTFPEQKFNGLQNGHPAGSRFTPTNK